MLFRYEIVWIRTGELLPWSAANIAPNPLIVKGKWGKTASSGLMHQAASVIHEPLVGSIFRGKNLTENLAAFLGLHIFGAAKMSVMN